MTQASSSIFPRIQHLKDVTPYIENEPQFGVMSRGPFTVVDYHYQSPGSFDGEHAAIRRECRGLIFDGPTGRILGRRFHKFFNVNEKPETQLSGLPIVDSTLVMAKLDGSMISPVAVDGNLNNIRWTTRMGITEKAMEAEASVARNPVYERLARELLSMDLNPIFEYVGPSNRIVIDYAEESLILLAVRDIVWGDYLMHEAVVDYGKEFNIPVVPASQFYDNSPAEAFQRWRDETHREGYVLRFFDGSMVKVKNDWYVRLHKTKETLDSPRLLVQAIIEAKVDDLLGLVTPEDADLLRKRETEFWDILKRLIARYRTDFNHYHSTFSRKDFATGPAKNLPMPLMRAIFSAWDGDITIDEAVLRHVDKLAYQSNKAFALGMQQLFGKGLPAWIK